MPSLTRVLFLPILMSLTVGTATAQLKESGDKITPPITPELQHVFTVEECQGVAQDAFVVTKAKAHGLPAQKALQTLYVALHEAKGKEGAWVKTDADIENFLDLIARIYQDEKVTPGIVYDGVLKSCMDKFHRAGI